MKEKDRIFVAYTKKNDRDKGTLHLMIELDLEVTLSLDMITRNTLPSSKCVYYVSHLYFSGLSLRKTSERLSKLFKRNHVFFAKKWSWIRKYYPKRILLRKKIISEHNIDETLIKIGSAEFISI